MSAHVNGKLIRLNDDGTTGEIVQTRASTITIGTSPKSDYYICDSDSVYLAYEISEDELGHVRISNKCDMKLLVDGETVLTERPLFSNSLITISNKVQFRWFHNKTNDSIDSSGSSFASLPIEQSSYISEENEEIVLSEDFSEVDSNALITVSVKVEPGDQFDQIPNDFHSKTPTHDQQCSNSPIDSSDANNNRIIGHRLQFKMEENLNEISDSSLEADPIEENAAEYSFGIARSESVSSNDTESSEERIEPVPMAIAKAENPFLNAETESTISNDLEFNEEPIEPASMAVNEFENSSNITRNDSVSSNDTECNEERIEPVPMAIFEVENPFLNAQNESISSNGLESNEKRNEPASMVIDEAENSFRNAEIISESSNTSNESNELMAMEIVEANTLLRNDQIESVDGSEENIAKITEMQESLNLYSESDMMAEPEPVSRKRKHENDSEMLPPKKRARKTEVEKLQEITSFLPFSDVFSLKRESRRSRTKAAETVHNKSLNVASSRKKSAMSKASAGTSKSKTIRPNRKTL